jgi:hypothetical protein
MKNILEIDLTKYYYYAFTDLTGDFEIQFNTPGGYINLDSGYEIFSIENGSIVAFHALATVSFHDCIFKKGNQIRPIELTTYEDCVTTFDNKNLDKFNFYIFANSGIVPANYGSEVNRFNFTRCDTGRYGGITFEPAPNQYTYTKVFNILSFSGIGHIARLETTATENKNANHHSIYSGSRTLSGMFKLIHEWAESTKEPFNNTEEIALAAVKLLESLDMPQETLQEILSSQPDMQLARYIKGIDFSASIPFENFEEPESLKEYIYNKCRYKSLNTLFLNHPQKPEIPSSILEEEKRICEQVVYQFCFTNDIDIESKSVSDLLDDIRSSKGYNKDGYEIDPNLAIERLIYL